MARETLSGSGRTYKTEALKNMVANRFQLNFKRNVGPTSASIRNAQPRSEEEWEECYYREVRSREHIRDLGHTMYAKIHDEIIPALESITEDECSQYMHDLVITKTYAGYRREIDTVRDLLQKEFPGVVFHPAPDEWDRTLAIDFCIRIGDGLIGLQIKPITVDQIPDLHRWQEMWERAHEEFTERFGGRVVVIYHVTRGQTNEIQNPEVIEELKDEIARLESAS